MMKIATDQHREARGAERGNSANREKNSRRIQRSLLRLRNMMSAIRTRRALGDTDEGEDAIGEDLQMRMNC